MKNLDVIKWLIRMLVVAAALEVLIFNIRFWMDMNLQPVEIPLEYCKYSESTQVETDGSMLLEDEEGKNYVQLDFSAGDNIEVMNLELKAYCTDGDETWDNHNGETYAALSSPMVEATVVLTHENQNELLEIWQIGADPEKTDILTLPKRDHLQMISIQLRPLKGRTVRLETMRLNVPSRFSFHLLRYAVIFCFLFFVYLFQPWSSLWQQRFIGAEGRMSRHLWKWVLPSGLMMSIGVFILMHQNPVYIQGDGGFTPYRELAHALAEGHAYIQEEPPAELLALENPYDPVERLYSGVRFKLDYALFKGRYYVYFGIVPCLVFYLPVYMITGVDIPGWLVVYLLVILVLAGLFLLQTEIAACFDRELSVAAVLLLWMSETSILTLPLVIGDACAYYIPMLSAVACYLYSLMLYLKALRRIRIGAETWHFVGTASLLMSMVAGCRPQLIVAAAAILPVLMKLLICKENGKTTIRKKDLLAFLAPLLFVAALLMYYNMVRFGSPFEFGARYNLTFAYSYNWQMHMEPIVAGIYYYLFRLPHMTGSAPFLEMTQMDWSNPGLLANHISTGGIFMLYPVLFLCWVVLARGKERKSERWHLIIMGRIWLVLVFFMAAVTALLGGLMDRYRMDFSVFAALAFASAFAGTRLGRMGEVNVAEREIHKKIAVVTVEKAERMLFMLITAWTVWISGLSYLEEGVWWINNANPEWYTAICRSIEFLR